MMTPVPLPPAGTPQRAIHELTVLAEIAQVQFIAAQDRLNDHPLSLKAHLRIHTLHRVMQTLAALITMFASVGLAHPQPKSRRPRPALRTTPRASSLTPAARRAAAPHAPPHRAGAAPNPNPHPGARPHAPHRLTHPGAATSSRPLQRRPQTA